MSGRIPQDFIDDLINRADIVELIGSRIQLKKAGREYKACCPFHGEKTPSFTVSPDKGFYHCFGCGAHGTALGFVMEHDRLDFVDAVEELAAFCGLEVPREQGVAPEPSAPLHDILEKSARYYHDQLRNHAHAVEYLKERGLDGETAARFRIGYAPAGWDNLLNEIGTTPAAREQMQKAGLTLTHDDGRSYDRFRERIMFPIRDSRGRIVGFGGRVIGKGEPKYLNSPETPVFHKGQELYGLYEARQALRELPNVLVVEGYMDVVGLARHGINNAVATLGTATTPEHLKRLFRVTQEIVFSFDGDRAGRDAAWRALQVSLPEMREGRQVRFLFLPDGQDPDSMVREAGAAAFLAGMESSLPLSDYLLRELEARTDTASMDGRAQLAELAKPLLNRVPEGIYRELLTDRLAERVGMQPERLARLMTQSAEDSRASPPLRARIPPRPDTGRDTLIRHAIRLTLHYPGAAAGLPVPDELRDLDQPGATLLHEILSIAGQRADMSSAMLLERFRERAEAPHLHTLLTREMLLDQSQAANELGDTLIKILGSASEHREELLLAAARERPLSQIEKLELQRLQGRNTPPGQ